jgi:hypothetical protein
MKNLIYQYWDGNVKDSVRAGVRNMKAYAERIGAEYIFEDNPKWILSKGLNFGSYSAHYGAFKFIFEKEYEEYDNILFCDTDIFTVDNLKVSIFDNFTSDIGICEEPFQPKQRTITTGRITSERDNEWAKLIEKAYGGVMPRTEDNLMKVYNTGVVLYSKNGMKKAREYFVDFQKYVKLIRENNLDSFYTCDQPYLHAMLFSKPFDVCIMDNEWNSYVHGTRDKYQPKRRIVDHRTENTKFVHCQFPGADELDEETLLRVVNLPREQWGYDI